MLLPDARATWAKDWLADVTVQPLASKTIARRLRNQLMQKGG